MRTEARKIILLFTPMLLHQAVSLAAALLFRLCADQYGFPYDATLVVLIGNLIVIPIAICIFRRDGRDREVFGKEAVTAISTETEKARGQQGKQILLGVSCFLAGGLLNVCWSSVLNLLHIQTHFSNQVQEQLLSGSLIVQIIGLGMAAPLAEELIFRGLIYRRMRQLFPVWAAILLSALLFAVYHGNPIQMIFAFPMAVVLALGYEHGKVFIFPVLFHMGSNLTAILLQILL